MSSPRDERTEDELEPLSSDNKDEVTPLADENAADMTHARDDGGMRLFGARIPDSSDDTVYDSVLSLDDTIPAEDIPEEDIIKEDAIEDIAEDIAADNPARSFGSDNNPDDNSGYITEDILKDTLKDTAPDSFEDYFRAYYSETPANEDVRYEEVPYEDADTPGAESMIEDGQTVPEDFNTDAYADYRADSEVPGLVPLSDRVGSVLKDLREKKEILSAVMRLRRNQKAARKKEERARRDAAAAKVRAQAEKEKAGKLRQSGADLPGMEKDGQPSLLGRVLSGLGLNSGGDASPPKTENAGSTSFEEVMAGFSASDEAEIADGVLDRTAEQISGVYGGSAQEDEFENILNPAADMTNGAAASFIAEDLDAGDIDVTGETMDENMVSEALRGEKAAEYSEGETEEKTESAPAGTVGMPSAGAEDFARTDLNPADVPAADDAPNGAVIAEDMSVSKADGEGGLSADNTAEMAAVLTESAEEAGPVTSDKKLTVKERRALAKEKRKKARSAKDEAGGEGVPGEDGADGQAKKKRDFRTIPDGDEEDKNTGEGKAEPQTKEEKAAARKAAKAAAKEEKKAKTDKKGGADKPGGGGGEETDAKKGKPQKERKEPRKDPKEEGKKETAMKDAKNTRQKQPDTKAARPEAKGAAADSGAQKKKGSGFLFAVMVILFLAAGTFALLFFNAGGARDKTVAFLLSLDKEYATQNDILTARELSLDERELALNQREADLNRTGTQQNTRQRELDNRAASLDALAAELETLQNNLNTVSADINAVVEIYSRMGTSEAAAALIAMNSISDAANILLHMKQSTAATILGSMEAEMAAAISLYMIENARLE